MTMALEPLASKAGQDLAEKEVKRKVSKAAKSGAKGPSSRARSGSSYTKGVSAPKLNREFQGSVSRPRTRNVQIGSSHYNRSSRGGTDLKLKPPSILSGGGGKVSTLMVEWIIGLILIFWAMFSGNKQQLTKNNTHSFFWQFFAWNFIFFILALLMRGKNTGRAAVMFGGILVLGLVLLNTANITALSQLFSHAGIISTKGPSSSTSSSGAPNSGNTVQNAINSGVSDVTHLPGGLVNDILNNPVGRFINPVTNPLTGGIIHFFEGLF